MGRVIGIDLGTNNAVVAVLDGREPRIIQNDEGSLTTPCVVAWGEHEEVLVGQAAKRQAVTNPQNTVFAAKRFLGRRFEHVGEEARRVPYRVVADGNGDCAFDIRGNAISPVVVTAQVLKKLKTAAEAELHETVTDAVIAVPAYFDAIRWEATKDAARMAGIEGRYVNEPTAAALAYRLHERQNETFGVYDFGGGTFDVSILEVKDGAVRVLVTNGDTFMGGDDFDRLIVDWMIAQFRRTSGDAHKDRPGVNLRSDRMALQRVTEAAEKAKIELSSVRETTINLPFLTVGDGGPIHLELKLSRDAFERMIAPLVERSFELLTTALGDSKRGALAELLMVGGSSQVPFVIDRLSRGLGIQMSRATPSTIVAMGAAVAGSL